MFLDEHAHDVAVLLVEPQWGSSLAVGLGALLVHAALYPSIPTPRGCTILLVSDSTSFPNTPNNMLKLAVCMLA